MQTKTMSVVLAAEELGSAVPTAATMNWQTSMTAAPAHHKKLASTGMVRMS
jgi:hypothetical protein